MKCLLCHSKTTKGPLSTFDCLHCHLRFKDPAIFLSQEAESSRYQSHDNNPADPGYRNFLNKLVAPLAPFLPAKFDSLDFGCGSGPTISLMLKELGGNTHDYDPLFFPHQSLLVAKKYDVVTSTEVVEHFKSPDVDWALLIGLVKPGGILAIMTQFLKTETDYATWWYKNDPTHIVFYREETFVHLESTYRLKRLFWDGTSVAIFRKDG